MSVQDPRYWTRPGEETDAGGATDHLPRRRDAIAHALCQSTAGVILELSLRQCRTLAQTALDALDADGWRMVRHDQWKTAQTQDEGSGQIADPAQRDIGALGGERQ